MQRIHIFWVALFLFSPFSALAKSSGEIEALKQNQTEIRAQLAEAINLVNQARQEFSTIRGTLDESAYFGRTHNERIATLEEMIRTLQEQIGALSLQLNDLIKGAVDPKVVGKRKEEADAFLLGLQAFNAGNLKAARETLDSFMKRYPKSEWTPNALYWSGETLYRQGAYREAVAAYQKVVERYPQSTWTRQAVYKQGVSFYELNDYDSAQLFFEKVLVSYRRTAEAFEAERYKKDIEAKLAEQKAAQEPLTVPPPTSPLP